MMAIETKITAQSITGAELLEILQDMTPEQLAQDIELSYVGYSVSTLEFYGTTLKQVETDTDVIWLRNWHE